MVQSTARLRLTLVAPHETHHTPVEPSPPSPPHGPPTGPTPRAPPHGPHPTDPTPRDPTPRRYCSDLWNVMDWINFFFFFLTYMQVQAVDEAIRNPDCSSYMCVSMGALASRHVDHAA